MTISRIRQKWLSKGPEADVAVFLIPARTDTAWFHDHALKASEIRFFRGRLKFVENHISPRDGKDAAPFPSMLVIYKRQYSPNNRAMRQGFGKALLELEEYNAD